MKCKCPNCGTKFKLKIKAKKDKAEPTPVRPAPMPTFNLTSPKPKKYRTTTDVGAFRQALYNCGFATAADSHIFNDKNTDSRRLKLWFASDVLNSSVDSRDKLRNELVAQFGDRLLMCGSYHQKSDHRPNRVSYIIRLKL